MAYMSLASGPQFNLSNATSAPPLPGQNWWSGGTAPIRPIADRGIGAYYTNDSPRTFWTQVGQEVGGGNMYWTNFWDNYYNQARAQYEKDSEGNINLQFPDWVTGQVADKALSAYQLLDPTQRGIDRRKYDPGRFDTGY